MNEQRRTDITGTQAHLKVFNLQAEDRETWQRAERRGQREEKRRRGELIDRRLSSVTITDAQLNKSSRHVAARCCTLLQLSDLYTVPVVCNSSLMLTEVSIGHA